MAHSLSARKRHRQSLVRQERNRSRRSTARNAATLAREAMASGTPEDAQAAVRAASAILDRTARKGVIHPNNASRRKHRLAKQLNALAAGGESASGRKAAPAKGRKTATRGRAKKS